LLRRLPAGCNATLKGLATTNQIDVLWDFTDAAGRDHRVILAEDWRIEYNTERQPMVGVDLPDPPD